MKPPIFLLFCLVLNSVLVSTWGHIFEFNTVRIDFFMPLVVWYAIYSKDWVSGLLLMAVTGLIYDLVSSASIYVLNTSAIFLLARYVVTNASMELWWQRFLLVIMTSFIFQASLRTLTGYIETVWPWGALQAIVDGMVALVIFPACQGFRPALETRDTNERAKM